MAYDEELAGRIRKVLARRRGVSERKMFGGIAFLHHGNMFCGVNGRDLMLRLGKDGAEAALDERHTREMDFTGTPLSTMVYVSPAGFRDEESLKGWVMRALDYAKTLPKKKGAS